MNVRLEFDQVNRAFKATFPDRLLDQEFGAMYRSMPGIVASLSPRCAIADFSALERFEVSLQLIRDLSHAPRVLPEGVHGAIVARTDVAFGTARMFQILRNRAEVHVVNLEEAYQLLGIVNPCFELLR